VGTILIRQRDGEWRAPVASVYEAEDALQRLLSAHPQLIPGVPPGSFACREFQTDAGRTDIVVVDPDGAVTVVECKLGNNPQVRREIVGQLFDYASRLGEMHVDEFDAQWARRTGQSVFARSDSQESEFREAIERNLTANRFRLVLAVDVINAALRRIVEYLNRITDDNTTIIAVEYARYSFGDIEVLTPQTYGEDLAEVKSARQAHDSQVWSLDDIADWVQEHEPTSAALFESLSTGLQKLQFTFRSGGSKKPAGIFARSAIGDLELRPIQIAVLSTAAGGYLAVELNFASWAKAWGATDERRSALQTLQENWANVPSLSKVMEPIRDRRGDRRSIRLSLFDETAQAQMLASLASFVADLT